MRRTALLVFIATIAAVSVAAGTTNVEVEPTGARHGLAPGLALRGRFESRTWDLELQRISPANAAVSDSLDGMGFDADVLSFGAEVLFSIGRRVELRGIVTMTEIDLDGGARGRRFDLDTDLGLLYGVGLRVGLPAWLPGWDLDLDFELLRGKYDDADFVFSGGGPLASATGADLEWKQFSIAPTISKNLKLFTPYAGLRFAMLDAIVDARIGTATEELSFDNEDFLSLVVGTRVTLGSLVQGDVHVDLLSNEGVVVSVAVLF
jgi:hypothetical protein